MMSQISDFVEGNKILSDRQYGFRKGKSIGMIINRIVERLKRIVDGKQIAIGVFMDLSKAFDSMDIRILLKKLKAYGFSNKAVRLISSFLTDRMQFIKIFETLSYAGLLNIGVPQGSLLGPLLFFTVHKRFGVGM
jgi:hypothetical protein